MLEIDDAGNIEDVAFTGRGCAISQASASMLTDEIKGKPRRHRPCAATSSTPGHRDKPGALKCAMLSTTPEHVLGDRGGGEVCGGSTPTTPAT
jgi:hypothetical protein